MDIDNKSFDNQDDTDTCGCGCSCSPQENAAGQASSVPPPPSTVQPVFQTPPAPQPAPKGTSGWRIFLNILLVMSILGNIVLVLAVIGLAISMALGSTGGLSGKDKLVEKVLVEGSSKQKIAVINVYGIIDDEQYLHFKDQLDAASDDSDVAAMIVRIASPGGSVSASDRIYNQIIKYREKSGKPVIAFMQTLAASGGYYTAVAADTIIAEPTAITGSIGVIMSHLSIKDLLEQKLGILPSVVKSGEKKDWPSMFTPMTDDQKAYINTKLIDPAYQRFVDLVFAGRQKQLTREQILKLADGSIYGAIEAKKEKLIDDVGYFEDAVAAARDKAGDKNAAVVEFEKPYSLMSVFGAQSKSVFLDKQTVEKMLTPQLLYLWDGNN